MKEIPLTQGKVALVDDEDYDYLMQWKWNVTNPYKNIWYARRTVNLGNNRYKTILMHRVILNIDNNALCDHKDHDGLNNQKDNLRSCTEKENMVNRRSCHKTSIYLGVHFYKKKYIVASITVNCETIYLGTFKEEKDAAIAYDKAALKYHGEFANLNFK